MATNTSIDPSVGSFKHKEAEALKVMRKHRLALIADGAKRVMVGLRTDASGKIITPYDVTIHVYIKPGQIHTISRSVEGFDIQVFDDNTVNQVKQ